jgi:hypothetical protein
MTDAISFEQHVRDTLLRKGIRGKVSGSRLFIACPFHKEVEPSCTVNLKAGKFPVGSFKCFGCGKRGTWNDLAAQIGAAVDSEEYDPGDPFLNIEEEMLGNIEHDYQLPRGCKPWTSKWRKLPIEFLQQFDPLKWYDTQDEVYRVLFPVVINDDTIGHIGAYLPADKHKVSVRYRDSAGAGWKLKALFPWNQIESNYLVLVEGPYDALRLMYHGISAAAILGTNNWSKIKADLVVSRAFDKVFILMDGDTAGYKANRVVYKALKKLVGEESVDMIDLPQGLDPGDMPIRLVKNLRKYIARNGGDLG